MTTKIGIILMTLAVVGMVWYDHQSYGNAYKQGRQDMFAEMIEATGGPQGSKLQVITPVGDFIYHPAGICATCHPS